MNATTAAIRIALSYGAGPNDNHPVRQKRTSADGSYACTIALGGESGTVSVCKTYAWHNWAAPRAGARPQP
jgi:hypothetical protein